QKAKPKGYFYKRNISMVNIVCFLDLEGNIGIIGAKSPFFFDFVLFIHISDRVPPFFGILNLITEIATKMYYADI
ncbi:MAG: hypothetical protein AMK69_26030, partial [Nitrospira bacterium SG8_3]